MSKQPRAANGQFMKAPAKRKLGSPSDWMILLAGAAIAIVVVLLIH